MIKKNIFTKEGYEKLKKKLQGLEEKRKGLVEEMELARQAGDLAENSAYHQIRETVSLVSSQIDKIESQMVNAQIVSGKNGDGVIDIGSKVVVEVESQKKNFEIVGNGEVNPLNGKVSYQSPIGSSLIGKRKGDTLKVKTPSGETEYRIIEIG